MFDYIQFSKFHTHNGDDTLPSSSSSGGGGGGGGGSITVPNDV